MPFMPFHILGLFFRALLAPLLLAAGVYLLYEWYQHREQVVEPAPAIEQLDRPGGVAPPTEPSPRVVVWHFGFNKETAMLVGGLLLSFLSVGGGMGFYRLLRRRGDKPEPLPLGRVETIKRPDGTSLYVEIHGRDDLPTLVLTHGWGLDLQEWRYAVRELGAYYRVIIWDLPGLGRSTRPENRDWSLEKLANDLHAVVGLAGGRPVSLIGHSIGGMITLTYCRLFPESLGTTVERIAVAHSTYCNPVRTTSMAGLYTALQKPVLEPLCYLMIGLSPLFRLLNAMSYINGSAHRSTERSSFSGNETWDQLDFLSSYYLTVAPDVIARGMLGMFDYDATSTLPTIPVPALIVAGERDNVCLPEASQFMADRIPRGQLVTLATARHTGLFEFHRRFADQLRSFLGITVDAEPVQSGAR